MSNEIIKVDDIQSRIFTIRGMQVMLDSDLAELYGVETKVLNQAVKRNKERFPERFHFQISNKEFAALRSQTVTLEENVLNLDGSSKTEKENIGNIFLMLLQSRGLQEGLGISVN